MRHTRSSPSVLCLKRVSPTIKSVLSALFQNCSIFVVHFLVATCFVKCKRFQLIIEMVLQCHEILQEDQCHVTFTILCNVFEKFKFSFIRSRAISWLEIATQSLKKCAQKLAENALKTKILKVTRRNY
jgi:hypothetical protein